MTDYSADIENIGNVCLDDLKLVFSQAEKKLDDSIKNFDATTSKSLSFITLCTAFLVAQSAYFFSNLYINGQFDPKLTTVFLASCYTFVILLYLIDVVFPKSYFPMGTNPEDLFLNEYFTEENKRNGVTTTYLYLTEIESYNRRIKHNFELNAKRLSRLKFCIKAVCLLPVLYLAFYFAIVGIAIIALL